MQKDIRASNIYLGKFADLMRKTLDASGQQSITLQEEIDLLTSYIELEKLRFGQDFSFNISIDLDGHYIDEIRIPSMLIQPYVENAVKHGLLHKTGVKILDVKFYIKKDKLICEISDNGIGRKKSTEIKLRRKKQHPSFSSHANKKRIELFNEMTTQTISLKIIDLFQDGISHGTKVVLGFPLPQNPTTA